MNFAEANLDAGLRRHDETSLRLKHALSTVERGDGFQPERDINIPNFAAAIPTILTEIEAGLPALSAS